jgi:DNA primase
MTPIEQIKAKLDIVDFIGETVKLRKSGRAYAGFCPFHANTQTPAFYVFPETQSWHCFGACGTGGDLFTFVMKRENVDFREALRTLAQRAGVELTPRTPQSVEDDARIVRLREVLEAAVRYYHNLLINSPAAKDVRAYLTRRGITEPSIVAFQLGYAPDAWDALWKYLQGRGYQPKDLLEAGLISERDPSTSSGRGYYDRFRQRLMFPIRDARGRTIGFGARALSDEQQPKYLNSPQTPLFDKSAVLYALDLAKDAIRAQNVVVIVEGYVDALMAHQQGFKNVVASMGTALTETQLKTLQRMAKKFILALDADAAGLEAMRRGLSVAQQALDKEYVPTPINRNLIAFEGRLQSEIRVAVLPSGLDPDDLLRQNPQAWHSVLDGALPVVDFLIQRITEPLDLETAKGKSEAARTLLPLIQELSDGVARNHYLQVLARKLRVDERVLLGMGEAPSPRPPTPRAQPKRAERATPSEKFVFGPEEYCLALLLSHPAELATVEQLGLQAADFARTEQRQIFEAFKQWCEFNDPTQLGALRETLAEALVARFDALLANTPSAAVDVMEIEKAALRLRERAIRQQIERLRFLEDEARRTNAVDEMQEYRQLILNATEHLKWTQDALRARSYAARIH